MPLLRVLAFAGFYLWLFFSIAHAKEIRYDTAQRRDPFIPLRGVEGGGGGGELPIEGIIFDPQKGSYVVVKGEIYREGEEVEGSTVIKILSDRVVFSQESKEVIVWLREEILKKEEEP